jgi:hypothetical protein
LREFVGLEGLAGKRKESPAVKGLAGGGGLLAVEVLAGGGGLAGRGGIRRPVEHEMVGVVPDLTVASAAAGGLGR